MTRLTDLPPAQAKRLAELECPDFATRPWVTGPALSQRRVAIVSSAGLVVRGEDPFRGRDADYRVIPADTKPDEPSIAKRSINGARGWYSQALEPPARRLVLERDCSGRNDPCVASDVSVERGRATQIDRRQFHRAGSARAFLS